MEFYRYELERGNRYPALDLVTLNLVKETPKGYWICLGNPHQLHGFHKWVSKTSRKRYAYPSKEEALQGYLNRTETRIRYLEADLEKARSGFRQAKMIMLELKEYERIQKRDNF